MSSEENLSCPICHEVFKDPVLLSCSHSFCKECLRSWWREKPTQECPVCKRRSSRSDPPRNLALRNLCEAYVQQRQEKGPEEGVCQVHSEKFKLFCLTDQQPVCLVCRDSKDHKDHRFRPIAEAAQDLKDELDKSLLPLKENLQKAKNLKQKMEGNTDLLKTQFRQQNKQIQAEFKKRHQLLVEEKESRMKTLKEEKEQKTQMMKDKMVTVSRKIDALSESIRATEEQLTAPDVSFLLKYKAAVERVQRCPLLEEEPQAKHLDNLTFNIWTNMKKLVRRHPIYFLSLLLCCVLIVCSVFLGPNATNQQGHRPPFTLDPIRSWDVVLSDDLTSFTFIKEKTDKETPYFGEAYGSVGFDSGFHGWDVEVGDGKMWRLGVSDDVNQWYIFLLDGKYEAAANDEDYEDLELVTNPQKIRVCLDCDKHEVSFYDLDTNSHIHTFTEISHKKLIPKFFNGDKSLIKILPQTSEPFCPFDGARNWFYVRILQILKTL